MPDPIVTTAEETPNPEQPIKYDARQQEHINSLLAREREAAERKFNAKIEQEKSELASRIEELQKQINSPKTKDKPQGDDDPEVLKGKLIEFSTLLEKQNIESKKWQTQFEQKAKEAEQAKRENSETLKKVAITSAAQKAKFRDTNEIIKLTQDEVVWNPDLNRFVVLNEHGQPRMNEALEPLSLEGFYLEYAEKKKYLVHSDFQPGLGTTPSTGFDANFANLKLTDLFGKDSKPQQTMRLKKENITLYNKLRDQAKRQGLVPE